MVKPLKVQKHPFLIRIKIKLKSNASEYIPKGKYKDKKEFIDFQYVYKNQLTYVQKFLKLRDYNYTTFL